MAMNDLDDLRVLKEWDADAAPLTDDARHRARISLFAAMNASPPARAAGPVMGRRPLLRLAVTATATAAVAGTTTLLVLDKGDREDAKAPRMRSVSAATLLNGAAARERRNEKGRTLAPRDDQFIYTKEIIKETEAKTGRTRTYVDENWRSVDGSQRSWIMEIGHGWWSDPVDRTPDDPHLESVTTWPPQDWTELKKLPTDPEKLILKLRGPSGTGRGGSISDIGDQEWWMIEFRLAGLLKLVPVMPTGLRPAAYEALSMVPGVKAVPGQKDSNGRTGVAIVYKGPTGRGFGSYFIFDPDTYEFLGFRDTRTSGDGASKKTYTQLSYLDSWAITDRAKQQPS
jgi:hypothetical protein